MSVDFSVTLHVNVQLLKSFGSVESTRNEDF